MISSREIFKTQFWATLWAGVSLGGAMIAAPAKFQATSLTRSVALDVGRAQFHWIGIAELCICSAFILSLVFKSGRKWKWVFLPVILFAIQRLLIMPPLDARTLDVIAGNSVGPSSLHILFIVLETAKLLVLIAIGMGLLNTSSDSQF